MQWRCWLNLHPGPRKLTPPPSQTPHGYFNITTSTDVLIVVNTIITNSNVFYCYSIVAIISDNTGLGLKMHIMLLDTNAQKTFTATELLCLYKHT